MTRAAFQGELGAFSEQGIRQLWGEDVTPVPMRDFTSVAQTVANGDAEVGLLPAENTLAGTVIGAYDAIFTHDALHVVAETVVPIHHCVLGVPGTTLASLRAIMSHPVALAQCERFFREHRQIEATAFYDTAGAARDVARRGEPTLGAIAGESAARRYGLVILAPDIEDRSDNQTRFFAIARAPALLASSTPARSIFVVTTDNVPGALLRVLEPLAMEGVNLSKLESRPTGEPWTYRFFLECEHVAGDAAAARALDAIRAVSRSFRRLGTIARWEAPQKG